MMGLLAGVGFEEPQRIGETVKALRGNGFHLPRAWAKPQRVGWRPDQDQGCHDGCDVM